ncbi:hypothetical protein ACAX60_001002 [Serratia marcescens]
MIIRQADVIESIHTGNTFVVEYVSEDGHFFILHPKDGEKSRGYNIHELNSSFVKVPYVSLSNEGDMIKQQIEPQNIPNNIPGDLAAAVNRLLDCDGTRGHFSAIRCSDAREEVEHLLAQPVSSGYKLVPVEPTENMIIDGFESDAFMALADAVNEKNSWPYGCRESAECVEGIFKAMLAAAPEGGNG